MDTQEKTVDLKLKYMKKEIKTISFFVEKIKSRKNFGFYSLFNFLYVRRQKNKQ